MGILLMIEVLLVSEELMILGYAETDTCWIMLGIYDDHHAKYQVQPDETGSHDPSACHCERPGLRQCR